MVILNAVQHKFLHLAQFLSAFGNSFLPKEENNSHLVLHWDIAKSALLSQKTNNTQLELSYKDIMLRIVQNDTIYELDLLGVNEAIIKNWIVENLEDFNLSPELYNTSTTYNLETPFDGFTSVDNEEEMAIYTAIEHRNIAQKCLEELALNTSQKASTIIVCPKTLHSKVTIDKSLDNSFSKYICCGYSPSNDICEVPYFFGYVVDNKRTVNYTTKVTLTVGTWQLTEDFKGIILPANFTDNITIKSVNSFYNEAIYALSKLL
ncbi:hypothetical protein NBRC110019_01170 [Neptunitalea chrysea]|uniref:Uncharacterized protein n=1 Tax=Neptunitalea chrysea TaxID=1647581 RepID=A0A9W6B2F4_9FLAO|nr:hypothetical protein [Neptunitalea chrysea]GLB51078.1 hypothetical protein NBRC110019_01170 [Neptunitalea chrysea]